MLACPGSHHRSPVCHQTALELLRAPPKGTGGWEGDRMGGEEGGGREEGWMGGWERGWEGGCVNGRG